MEHKNIIHEIYNLESRNALFLVGEKMNKIRAEPQKHIVLKK